MIRLKNFGMSLIELMVVSGIASVLLLGIVSMLEYANKTTRNLTVAVDWNITRASIFHALSAPNVCTRVFKKESIHLDFNENYDEAHALDVKSLGYDLETSGGTAHYDLLNQGQNISGVVIKSIKLWMLSPDSPNGLVRLKIQAEKNGKTVSPFQYDFPVLFSNEKTIESCQGN